MPLLCAESSPVHKLLVHNLPTRELISDFACRYPAQILETLLRDRTTGCNIIWADDEYEALGAGYARDDEITLAKITGTSAGVIEPRIAKELERQSWRTKNHAEVFTPSWLCNQMNNDIDEVWFGRRDVFNREGKQGWTLNPEPVVFPRRKGRDWHAYVESPRLEIACGEAPFVCSRYDAVTGRAIPVGERIGFLDRKLRVISEKTRSRKEWVKQALTALAASYGFEYQGDNLLIARINVFETFCEYFFDRWGQIPGEVELDRAAQIVSWNFWQMDGLTGTVPTGELAAAARFVPRYLKAEAEFAQSALFDLFDSDFAGGLGDRFADGTVGESASGTKGTSASVGGTTGELKMNAPKRAPFCVLCDWNSDRTFTFVSLRNSFTSEANSMEKKFYAVIGNPPYQEQQEGENRQYAPPIYHHFMDEAYRVGGGSRTNYSRAIPV